MLIDKTNKSVKSMSPDEIQEAVQSSKPDKS